MEERKEQHPACNLDGMDAGDAMNLCCCLIMDDDGGITDPCPLAAPRKADQQRPD